jgi:ribonuclease Z
VLIHEATFDDTLATDAHYKKHTTMGQAMDIALKVNAYRTVLTHFSPRYQKVAEISQRHMDNKVLVAFDHMRFRISYLEWAYKFIDIYAKLFKNDDVIET